MPEVREQVKTQSATDTNKKKALGLTFRRFFTKPEVVPIRCDIHAWMSAARLQFPPIRPPRTMFARPQPKLPSWWVKFSPGKPSKSWEDLFAIRA